MNRKTIIQILVIAICLGAASLVLYNSLFKGDDGSGAQSAPDLAGQGEQAFNPLPYGDNLSGELKRVLGRNNLQYGLLDYPKLDVSEVGIPVTGLLKGLERPEQ